MIKKNIDYLVLGCTHYPYLIPIIEKILPKGIKIIDSGEAVAKHTKIILAQQNLLINQQLTQHKFYTNKDAKLLTSFLPKDNNIKVKYLDF